MSAYSELINEGIVGPSTLAMLMSVGRQLVESRNYPDPDEKGHWTDNDVAELVHDMVAAESQTVSFVDDMLASSVDEDSLRRVVAHRVAIAFAERARATDAGHLSGRIMKLLKDPDNPFVDIGAGWWSDTPNREADLTTSSRDDLLRAAYAVPHVRFTRWNLDSERRAPFAPKDDLERLVTAIIDAAGGRVHKNELIAVLKLYFGLRPETVDIDDDSHVFDLPATDPDASASSDAQRWADFIWTQLEPDARRVLPYLEDSATDIATATGLGRTRANNMRREVRTVLTRALGLETPQSVSREIAAHAIHLLQERATDAENRRGGA
ncbi:MULTISPECIES: hypothetical protein [unclassified Aeromicrobium]|uniref:hypothetical protein n=1 Tax=unclassified Aeromicrobium TaxID=2633570 RepID=UPI00288BF35F|nr:MULTISPECIES: hypothetical protein [unclassified Aeromicrobium]